MGTLTANSDRLPGYCEHKLPTSCRLTSIPQCCACADERAHAASYSTYIDGIGFVLRGTRWQRYCWFCKEFWENRVRVSGLRTGQTRIPSVPDQSEFLERWYEFHRGYRIVKRDDGGEERVAVLGEDFKEVSPGCLPRTLEELREGRSHNEPVQVVQNIMEEETNTGPSLDETLDRMFQDASLEEAQAQQPETAQRPQSRALSNQVARQNIHAQAMVPTGGRSQEYQARRVAALRRELHRMRNGIERVISGLRDLGEEVPNHAEATARLTGLGRALDDISGIPSSEEAELAIRSIDALTAQTGTSEANQTLMNIQVQVDQARIHMVEARRNRDQAASELDLAESEHTASQDRLRQLQREQRTTENYMRIFGTREEMLAQGDSYESPIGGMFTRAMERFRAAEEVRRETRTLRHVLQDEERAGGEIAAQRLAELEAQERDVWGVPRPPVSRPRLDELSASDPAAAAWFERYLDAREERRESPERPQGEEAALEQYYRMIRQQEWARQAAEGLGTTSTTAHLNNDTSPQRSALSQNFMNERNEMTTSANSADNAQAGGYASDYSPTMSNHEWWCNDAEHVLNILGQDDCPLRESLDLDLQELSDLQTLLSNEMLTGIDEDAIDALLRNPVVIWQTALPTEWYLRRRRVRNADGTYALFPIDNEEAAQRYNALLRVELMAQAFQQSGSLRRRAMELTPPQRLQTCYRLQAGRRDQQDVDVLERMQSDEETFQSAMHVLGLGENLGAQEATILRDIDSARQEMARQGDHSRHELDAGRRATHAFALAAGRHAMQTGSQAVLQRELEAQLTQQPHALSTVAQSRMRTHYDGDDGTMAAYRRLHASGFLNIPENASLRSTLYRPLTPGDHGILARSSPDDVDAESDGEEPDAVYVGLDARDTGRPEPKSEEELRVQMECKICYTQLAEIACLPCGHLVMCRFCSDQHSPTLQHDRTRPRRAAGCPVCRKGVRQKVRVYRA